MENRRARILSQLEDSTPAGKKVTTLLDFAFPLRFSRKTIQTRLSFRIIETNEILHVELLVTTNVFVSVPANIFTILSLYYVIIAELEAMKDSVKNSRIAGRSSPFELTKAGVEMLVKRRLGCEINFLPWKQF